MLFKLSGAALVALSLTAAGYKQADKLRRKAMISRSLTELFMWCSFLIRSESPTVYEICKSLKQQKFAAELPFITFLPEEYSPDMTFSELWQIALQDQRDLPDEENALLIRLSSHLGRSDTEGQLSMIAALTEEAGVLYERRQAEYRDRGKLCRSVWTLAGLMVAVMII